MKSAPSNERLLSLDFFRGITMFLLIAEFTSLFNYLVSPELNGTWLNHIGEQLHHHPWNGLRFWDLIQPFFMFIVGVAMPFSFANRKKRGHTNAQIRKHVWKRALLLLLLGWGLYCVGAGRIVFRFQNVLAQLSVTYLLAYFIIEKPFKIQFGFSLLLIVITELLYRWFSLEGYDQPFTINENFGTWLDLQYGGADLNGGWVSFNAIPTAAHTIWGVMAGKLLLSDLSQKKKLKTLITAAVIGMVVGYLWTLYTPIIKRICTSSFILVSGGWTILFLAISYWIIDMKKWNKGVLAFAIVGMNPLFIYLFAHLGGAGFIENIVNPFTTSLLGWSGDYSIGSITSLIVLFLLWYICYWMYRKNIFIRI